MKQIAFFIFLLLSFFARAQYTGKISGKVVDESSKEVISATISLLKGKDSSLVKTAVSDKNGAFEFLGIKEGEYFVTISSIGFKKNASEKFSVVNNDISLPPFTLTAIEKGLSGVTITAQKPFVETKIDRTVVNVDASPTSAGATAMEVLEKSPGIIVNGEGQISLRGKEGVIVMMDGKPTFLSPTDLANLLRNMPASALDQIEIMTNPSSKYDAAGNSGVINIKTKKGRAGGFNGSIMVGATTSIYNLDGKTYFIPKSQNSINFNYRKNKLNFFGNYNPNYFRGRNTMQFESRLINNRMETIGFGKTETRFRFGNFNQTAKLGLDWFANKKNVFGVVISGFDFDGHPEPSTVAELYKPNRELRQRLLSYTDNNISFRNFTANINWKHSFDSTGRELTMDADYSIFRNETRMLLTTDYYDSSLMYKGQTFLRGFLPTSIDIYSFKADYVQPFKNGRFEAGIKISYVNNDNLVDYDRSFIKDQWERDIIRSNHFLYKENINAGYINFSKQVKKWSFQAGLRVENTIGEGNQVTTKTKFRRDTTNFFPTAYLSYAANQKHTVTLSYGRRINRPNYQDLNPFIFFLDTLSYRKGNIFLKPQLSHNMELSHSFMGKFVTTFNFNQTDNVISQIIKPENDTSLIRFLTVDNVAKFWNYGLAITAPFKINKWWNLNIFGNVFNNRFKGVVDTFNVDLSKTSFSINITNSFTISKGFTAEISGFYRYKGLNNLSIGDPVYRMAFGLQKQVMKGKGTVRLNVVDPFAWQVFTGFNRYALVDGTYSFRPDIRQVTATFTWRFGSNGQNNQPRNRTTSSQEEQNRVGQGN
jgi:outer membrane cobalamin receptor